jgi:hypothetical protein
MGSTSYRARFHERTFREAFPGATGNKVLKLRAMYDPDGVLRRLDAADRPAG